MRPKTRRRFTQKIKSKLIIVESFNLVLILGIYNKDKGKAATIVAQGGNNMNKKLGTIVSDALCI